MMKKHKKEEKKSKTERRYCYVRWVIEKKILKERFGIDWMTPAEKNPNINFD